jgi:multiple sugar transport system substrate-binding protein
MKPGKKLYWLLVWALALVFSTISLAAPVKITVWSRGTPQYLEAYRQLEKSFMQQYPNIKVEHALFADLESKLLITFMGDQASDLWIIDTITTGRWVYYNMAMEINRRKFSNAKYIIPAAWETCVVGKRTYALPWSVQAQAMYYRADWLRRLRLKVPATWEEMVKVAVAFTTKDPDGNGKDDTYGIGVYGSTNRGYAYWTFQDWLWQAGGSVLKTSRQNGKWIANLDTPECKRALQFEKDLAFKYKVFQPGYNTADSAAVYGTFADGMTGMVFHAGYRIMEYRERLGKRLGTALMPAGPQGGWVLGEGENIYVNRNTKHKKEAIIFANWMLSPQAQKFGLKNKISNIVRTSVRRDINNLKVTGEPLMKAFVDAFKENVKYPEPIRDYYPVKILVSELAQKVISSPHSDIETLMRKYNAKVNQELKKQGIYGGK